ncbi:precorrin-6A/cobalt-precorrin-6A reductase, partial [Kitasatospora sp. NPDC093558]|uniref:precorrin-6A/cobalt-precorrin-6A reductase n=1 Tax=Kitasatospora sp. NPDC093558 TaxID=3155201 RepID=UPI0034486AF6
MARHVLILGGTTEGRALAAELAAHPHLRVTSSLAGRVAQPRLPAGEVRIGGFGGPDGLAA